MGRGRVQLKRIENKISRQVTFSKRRSGLLKKAQEISILCDAEVGVIIFSTKGKLFELSTDSSMERIVEKYEQHIYSDKRVSSDCQRKENWGLEYSKLTARIELLQRNISNYAGEDLDPLSWRELQNLEGQIDNALKRIRIKMNLLMNESISQLQKKERSLQEQNNLIAKQLKENEKQQVGESNNQQEEGLAKSTSTFKLPKSPSELHKIPSLTIRGSQHQTGDEEHDNQVRADSTIPLWLFRIADRHMERIVDRYEQHIFSDKRVGSDCERKENGCVEYSKPAARIELLQRNIRNYEGEDLDPLSWRELQTLEQQIDNALKQIQIRMLKENDKQKVRESNKQEEEGLAKVHPPSFGLVDAKGRDQWGCEADWKIFNFLSFIISPQIICVDMCFNPFNS